MDITNPFVRSTITHWEHKKSRFNLFRVLLTLLLIFQPFLLSIFSDDHITAPSNRAIIWIASSIIIAFILINLTVVEYIFSSSSSSSSSSWEEISDYATSYEQEFRTRAIITILIGVLHVYHQTGIKAILNDMLLQETCPACLSDPISSGLLAIGRVYIGEFFATTLSIVTLWCVSPRMVFLRSKKAAVFWFVVKYAVCLVLTMAAMAAMAAVWQGYCAGEDVCYGNVGLAAWTLLWVPLGRSIENFGPMTNLVGKQVLKKYSNRY